MEGKESRAHNRIEEILRSFMTSTEGPTFEEMKAETEAEATDLNPDGKLASVDLEFNEEFNTILLHMAETMTELMELLGRYARRDDSTSLTRVAIVSLSLSVSNVLKAVMGLDFIRTAVMGKDSFDRTILTEGLLRLGSRMDTVSDRTEGDE